MYQVIATDLDGALLNSDHQLDPFTIATVRRLAESGVHFVIATGRHYCDVAGFRYEIVDLCGHDGSDIAKVLYIGDPKDLEHVAANLEREYGTSLYVTYSLIIPGCLPRGVVPPDSASRQRIILCPMRAFSGFQPADAQKARCPRKSTVHPTISSLM